MMVTLMTCVLVLLLLDVIGGLVYERAVYILISNDDDFAYRRDRQCIGRLQMLYKMQ